MIQDLNRNHDCTSKKSRDSKYERSEQHSGFGKIGLRRMSEEQPENGLAAKGLPNAEISSIWN